MKYPSLGLWLCSLFAFFSITYAGTFESLNSDTCNIQAWVRAPDLEPGEIIPGQVKVQIDGPCNPISEYSLVLRFKERFWAKIPKPGVMLPEQPQLQTNDGCNNLSADERRVERNSVFNVGSSIFRDSLQWNEYTKQMKNATLWAIAEEERIAFETRHKISDGFFPQSKTQSIHDFALLVPTTDYPPSTDHNIMYSSTNRPHAERGHEHIYLYTVEVKFNNGSTIEVPAGLSSFNTVSPSPQILDSDTPEIVSFTANFTQTASIRPRLEHPESPLNISSDIEVKLPHGGHVEQGSILNLTFTSRELQGIPDDDRTNHTILLSSPSMSLHIESKSQHRHVEMFPDTNVPSEIQSAAHLRCHRFATSNDSEHSSLCHNDRFTRDEGQKPDWNISTSVPLKIPKVVLPSFDMYYQSIEAKIRVILTLRYIPIQDLLNNNTENDPWIPTMQTSFVENSKYFRSFRKDIPLTIHPRARNIPNSQITHYLSPGARQPVFVDPCKADELSRLSMEERNMLAPLSKSVIKKGTDQVVRTRYHFSSLYYVGNTWKRKVLDRGLKINFGENSRCGFSAHAQAQTGFMV